MGGTGDNRLQMQDMYVTKFFDGGGETYVGGISPEFYRY